MMYKNDFVAVVKENGKILRENGNTVYMPFGCEYSILLKNLRSRKALVKISIDGQDVLNGHKLIVNANSELELERFLEDMDKGNKFKFIQKTSKIQEHRGDKIDDGIVRIEFQYEAEVLQQPIIEWQYPLNKRLTTFPTHDTWYSGTTFINCNYSSDISSTSSMDTSMSVSNATPRGVKPFTNSATNGFISGEGKVKLDSLDGLNVPLQDEGITVKGSESTQSFKYGSVGTLESESHVITLMLKGCKEDGVEITQPITVKTKKVCPTCGEQNKSTNKFCADCGTFLN